MKYVSLPDVWWKEVVSALMRVSADSNGMSLQDQIAEEISNQVGDQ